MTGKESVIELLSPGPAAHDTLTKREIYGRNGVREYWIVDAKGRGGAPLRPRKKRFVVGGRARTTRSKAP